MGLVSAFRPPVVGLDLGSHAVKAVALRKSRRGWSLLAAGEAPLPPGDRVTQEQVSETAAALLDTLGLRRAHIAAAVSGQAVIVKRLARRDDDGWWVMGDDPASSEDSRHFGIVPAGSVVGRVVWRYHPLRRAG